MAKKFPKKKGGKQKSPAAEQRKKDADARQKRREELAEKVKAQLASLTEVSGTTAAMAMGHVEAFEAAMKEADELNEDIGGLRGSIVGHKGEIRKLTKDGGLKEAEKGRRIIGLEKDLEKWEGQMEVKKDERHAYRKAAESSMADLRRLIRDKAAGSLLFDQKDDQAKGENEGDDSVPK